MTEPAGRDAGSEVGLIREDVVLPLVRLTAQRHQVRRRVVGRGVGDARDDGLARRHVVARLVAERQARREVVLEAQGDVVLADVVVVVVRTAVVVRLLDGRGGHDRGGRQRADRGRRRRQAVVGEVVLPHDLAGEAGARRGVEAEGNRGGNRLAFARGVVAAGRAAVLPQRVDPEGGIPEERPTLAEGHRLIDVEGGADLVAGAIADRASLRRLQVRRFRGEVDVAGGVGPADVGAGRPREHFDLFEVVDVAGDQPVVAHAVDEEAVVGREAAHVEHVAARAGGAAAFAGLHGDPRYVAQRVGQGRGALLVEERARDHLDRLRCLGEGSRVLGRFDARQRAADLHGVGADANFDGHGVRGGEAVADAGAREEQRQRLLDGAQPADAGRGQRADAILRDRHRHAGHGLEALEHDLERTRRDVEGARGRLRRDGLVLPGQGRERFARRPDPDMGERRFEPAGVEGDARQGARATIVSGVKRRNGAEYGAEDEERRGPFMRAFMNASEGWRAMTTVR